MRLPETTPPPTTGIIQRTQHGTNAVGIPRYAEHAWDRVDIWTSSSDGHESWERRACAGPNDTSPIHDYWSGGLGLPGDGHGGYDPRCPCCWLHHSHTWDFHTAAIQ